MKRDGVDFLNAARRLASKVVDVAGTKVEVRGLTVGEIQKIQKAKKSDETIAGDLIFACCFHKDSGKPLFPNRESVDETPGIFFNALGEAVSEANGFSMGNSNATDSDVSSSV